MNDLHRSTGNSCDCCQSPNTIKIILGPAEQRKIVEASAGGPCFRMWLTCDEFDQAATKDWCAYPLDPKGERYAVWRRTSDLAKLKAGGDIDKMLAAFIEERILPDEPTNDVDPDSVPAGT